MANIVNVNVILKCLDKSLLYIYSDMSSKIDFG